MFHMVQQNLEHGFAPAGPGEAPAKRRDQSEGCLNTGHGGVRMIDR
jgi:hypothetical protein